MTSYLSVVPFHKEIAMNTYRIFVIAGGLMACAPLAQAADDSAGRNPALNDKWFFELGGYFPTSNTTAQLDSTSAGVGTIIDFKNVLGMDERAQAVNLAARWRFTERWRLEASYFETHADGNRTTNQNIQWGNKFYPAGSQLNSSLDVNDARVSVGYSLFKTTDKELGIGFGFHVMGYNASISSQAIGSESKRVTAPLPVITAYGAFSMDDKWSIAARLDRFSLTYNQYSGSITGLGLELLYQPFRHVGFGVGYQTLYIDFEATRGDFVGKINQNMQGPTAFLNASF
ncbi:MAG: hypothetical protein ACJ8G2_02655 [Burkholderiales bacterium]